MSRGGWEVDVSLGTVGEAGAAVVLIAAVRVVVGVLGLDRLASGEFGRDGGGWLAAAVDGGGVVDVLVIIRPSHSMLRRMNHFSLCPV